MVNVTWWASSSLPPAQIMEQEVNYAQAEDYFEVSFHMSAYITVLLTIYNHFHALLTKLQSRVGDTVERMIICVEKTLQFVKNVIKQIMILMK